MTTPKPAKTFDQPLTEGQRAIFDAIMPKRDIKPASAPPAALQEVVAFLLGEGPLRGAWYGDEPPDALGPMPKYWWRPHLRKALAASAQVREVEAWGYEFDDAAGAHHVVKGPLPSYAQSNIKPAAEPVPVAQDPLRDVRHVARNLRERAMRECAAPSVSSPELVIWAALDAAHMVIGLQQDTITDHARRESEQVQTTARIANESAMNRLRAEEAEASLAACRADAERLAFCVEKGVFPVRDQAGQQWVMFVAVKSARRSLFIGDMPQEAIDAAIDALRQEAP